MADTRSQSISRLEIVGQMDLMVEAMRPHGELIQMDAVTGVAAVTLGAVILSKMGLERAQFLEKAASLYDLATELWESTVVVGEETTVENG